MNADRMIKLGSVGAVVTLICCVTPVLVILFGVIGIGGLVAGLDIVLIPALIGFLGLMIFGFIRKQRARR